MKEKGKRRREKTGGVILEELRLTLEHAWTYLVYVGNVWRSHASYLKTKY